MTPPTPGDATPSDDEVAAIVVALDLVTQNGDVAPAEARPAAWSLAMRYPELEFDDLRSLAHACSTKS